MVKVVWLDWNGGAPEFAVEQWGRKRWRPRRGGKWQEQEGRTLSVGGKKREENSGAHNQA